MTVLRGPILWPTGPRRLVALDDGVVAPELPEPLLARRGDPVPEQGLILPAFGDWHFHWVQMGIAGAATGGTEPLLEWLRTRAWPAELRFADEARCRATVPAAMRRLAAAGTAAGAAWGSPHDHSAAAFLETAGEPFVCGPAVMTSGDGGELNRRTADAIAGLEGLFRRYRDRLAVAPRFALSCDESALRALGRFASDHRLIVQTHLAESPAEVEAIRHHFGTADSLEVYESAGLVGPRTLLAHTIHVSDAELGRIANSGACVVHCPTSNAALGSGRMPLERLRRAGVRWVMGSDVGAGPDLCLLDAIVAALDQHAGQAPVDATELLHRATLGRFAIAAGQTETDASGCGLRAGALVIDPPPSVDLKRPDAETWLAAILDDWRIHRTLRVRRVVPWPAV